MFQSFEPVTIFDRLIFMSHYAGGSFILSFQSTNWDLFVQCSRYNCYYVLIRVQAHIRGTSSVLQYQHM